ncbi:MAG: helix-turn-helix domain-containing protein [Pseudomonadota bacterium]|uniref:helix-turn-helix domain-containing protein n=1 Tax=Phenylobacterium zucineum TaxID=284016 RepID=UPI00164FB0AC
MSEPTAPAPIPARRSGAGLASEVGSRLRARRQRAGLSRPELAKALGVSERQLHDYEDGRVRASAAMLVRAAKVLGSTTLDFFPTVAQIDTVARKNIPR